MSLRDLQAQEKPAAMSGLQGKTTLTDAEKVTEARKHIEALKPLVHKMNGNEADFITKLAKRFEEYGDRTYISNKQLFFLRDLRADY
jgi:hypothetical protein